MKSSGIAHLSTNCLIWSTDVRRLSSLCSHLPRYFSILSSWSSVKMFLLMVSRLFLDKTLGNQVRSLEELVNTLDFTFSSQPFWKLVRVFAFLNSRVSLNIGHVSSKIRSPYQMIGKPLGATCSTQTS